jgi:triosephosphate isomerase
VIAYEPVWAIGTGQSATSEMIEEAHGVCKEILKKLCKKGTQTPVLYGGSVTPQTAHALSKTKNVDGALVGGASLEAQSFISIIQGFMQ